MRLVRNLVLTYFSRDGVNGPRRLPWPVRRKFVAYKGRACCGLVAAVRQLVRSKYLEHDDEVMLAAILRVSVEYAYGFAAGWDEVSEPLYDCRSNVDYQRGRRDGRELWRIVNERPLRCERRRASR